MIEKIEECIVMDNQFATIFNDKVVFKGKLEGTHYRVKPKSNGGVIVIPIMVSGEMVSISNFRYGVGSICRELPQGGVEDGESSFDAATRELLEETGLSCESFQYLGKAYASPSILESEGADIYIAWGCYPSEQKFSEDPLESIVSIETNTIQKTVSMFKSSNYPVDSNTLAALFYFLDCISTNVLKAEHKHNYAFLMGVVAKCKGSNKHSNPFRNKCMDKEYFDWIRGWESE